MLKLLSMEETKRIILEYIMDDRKNQAIFLNGEWGCGKTFFIKDKLIPEIEIEKYQIFQISLYGVSSVEKIQEMIYGKWLGKVVEDKTEKLGPVGDVFAKGIEIFGKSAVQFIEGKIGRDGSAADIAKDIFEQGIGKNKKPVLIFDDIERCQIDIIELMGFLNDLSENNGYKLILVANEQEINREDDDIVTALKYGIVLNNRLAIDDFVKKGPANNAMRDGNRNEIRIGRAELEELSKYYFGRKSTYERTREKLIGLTIPYSVSITESFDEIVSKYIKNISVKKIVQDNREEVFDLFEREGHKNLRTLIAACIAIEDIISSINQERISKKEFFKDELKTIVLYTLYSAMRRTDGKEDYNWISDTRYGCVNDGLLTVQDTKIYGYAFVDEYWKTQCIDVENVQSDIEKKIAERVAFEKDIKESRDHQTLALYRLIEWYLLPDEEVKQDILQMKEELGEKKYYPQEFKEIILTLMRINNPNFGLNPDKIQKSGGEIFDSTESAQFVGMSVVNQEAESHQYTDWKKINISEFIELMVGYFNDSEFELTKRMICVLSVDKQFAYNYRQLTMPLIEKIEKNERHKISQDENGTSISDIPWDIAFERYCNNNKSDFMNQGRFLSLFDYNKLIERFAVATPIEINNFCEGLSEVYSFSNLVDVYFVDYDIVKKICSYILKNINYTLNENSSRTKEIALRRLKAELNKYEDSLRRRNLSQ